MSGLSMMSLEAMASSASASTAARAGQKRKRQPPTDVPVRTCDKCYSHAKDRSEGILLCTECHKAGHPSCLALTHAIDRIQTYRNSWKCDDCKDCEVCKINDEHVIICESCDRAWHPKCLKPPLPGPPDGHWSCRDCPPVEEETDDEMTTESVASTSKFQLPSRSAGSRSTRSRSHRHSEVDEDEDAVSRDLDPGTEDDGDETEPDDDNPAADDSFHLEEDSTAITRPSRHRPQPRPSRDRSRNAKASSAPQRSQSPRKRQPMRLKLKLAARPEPISANVPVAPPPKTRLTLRLRLPPQPSDDADALDEPGRNPYEEVLLKEEADTSQTAIVRDDKQRFERARNAADSKLPPPTYFAAPSTPGAGPSTPGPGPSTLASRLAASLDASSPSSFAFRPLRSQSQIFSASMWDRGGSTILPQTPLTPGTPLGGMSTNYSTVTPSSDGLRIKQIRFGAFDIDTWYDAPFPEEYSNLPEGRLWMCEFCLKYMKSRFSANRHQLKCKARHPPGDEIYRDGGISVFEVDGRRNRIYCQNLCLLSKMFLHQKSLFYDVEPFLFYVMTEVSETHTDVGAHFVGYFSKEKNSAKGYNLSCIMTLPIHQRKGFGQFLIDCSYLLSRKENKPGGPERPLSSLGALSYKNYWMLAIMRYLHARGRGEVVSGVTVDEISAATAITREDVYTTLKENGMVKDAHGDGDGTDAPATATTASLSPPPVSPHKQRGRPKGRKNGQRKSGVRVVRPAPSMTAAPDDDERPIDIPPSDEYHIVWDADKVAAALGKWASKGYLSINPEKLEWSPYLLCRPGHALPAQTQTDEGISAVRQSQSQVQKAEVEVAVPEEERKRSQEESDRALAAKLAADELANSPGRPRRTRSGGASASLTPRSTRGGGGFFPPATPMEDQSSPTPRTRTRSHQAVPAVRSVVAVSRNGDNERASSVVSSHRGLSRQAQEAPQAGSIRPPHKQEEEAMDVDLEVIPGLRRSSEPLGTSADSVSGETRTPPGPEAPNVIIAEHDAQFTYGSLNGYGLRRTPSKGGVNGHFDGEEDAEGEDDPDA